MIGSELTIIYIDLHSPRAKPNANSGRIKEKSNANGVVCF
jgi:hypothetical protein